MKLTEKITSLTHRPQTTRVLIDSLTPENHWLLDWLWDNQYQLIVASFDNGLLNKTNNHIINLSGSMGRWRVVTYSQALIEPTDLFIMYKELPNEQILRLQSKQVITAKDYQKD